MTKLFSSILLTLISLQIEAQRIEYDVFNNLQFESGESDYKAYLKKNIFGDLIYSDTNNNELVFKKEYLNLKYKNLLTADESKADFLRYMVRRYSFERGYEATFAVDVLGNIIMEDNRNNRVEEGVDIFGNPTYEEKRGDLEISIKKDLFGNLQYKSNKEQAFLKKDIFNKWNYSDSTGNKFKFSSTTWNMLQYTYGCDKNIFLFLL